MGAAVVLHSDAAPVLEFGEEVLDLVAFLLGRFAVGDWLTAVFLRRDTCLVPLILKDFLEDTLIRPAHEPVVKCLVRAIFQWCITPAQPIADNEDYPLKTR